jgi:ribonuclease I
VTGEMITEIRVWVECNQSYLEEINVSVTKDLSKETCLYHFH